MRTLAPLPSTTLSQETTGWRVVNDTAHVALCNTEDVAKEKDDTTFVEWSQDLSDAVMINISGRIL